MTGRAELQLGFFLFRDLMYPIQLNWGESVVREIPDRSLE